LLIDISVSGRHCRWLTVFGGVMAGISFYLLNNVFGFMGNLQNWQPWLTAAAPAMIYSLVSLATFGCWFSGNNSI
jgi:lipopolysaccharide export LptBFGC system permease protein LptF